MLLTTLVVMLPAAYGGYVLDREYYEHTAEREEYRRLERMNYVAYDIRLIANGGRQPTVQQRIAGWAWSTLGALAIAAFAAWCTAALWNALGYLVHLIPDFPRGPAQSIEDRSPERNL